MHLFTVDDMLERARAQWPNKVFIISGDEVVTFGQVGAAVDRFAGWLYAQGIRTGDRVGVHMQKSAEEIVAMLAASKIGAAWVNLSVHWNVGQLLDQANDCGMRILVTGPRRASEVLKAEWPATLERIVVFGEGAVDGATDRVVRWDDASAALPKWWQRSIETHMAAICYTSGSTGRPKGVMLSHRNFVAATEIVAEYLGNTSDDRLLAVLPCCFNYGLLQVLSMLLVGGSVVLQRVTMAAELAVALGRHGITGVAAVPSIWTPLINYLTEEPGHSFPLLRYLTNAGGKLPDAALERLPFVFRNTKFYLMYGMTETIRATYLDPELFHIKRGAMGYPTRNTEIFVIDAEGRPCPPNEPGELVQRGPTLAMGYWGRPEATAEKFRPVPGLGAIGQERFCWSGDIVRQDEDGVLWFVGREDFMIKSNGVRVSPSEVEEVVHHFPGVTHAVAFGAPDPIAGQAIELAIQAGDEGLDMAEFRKFCRSKLPGYLSPRRIHLWPGRMPTTGNGKIDIKSVVKALLAEAEAASPPA